MEAMTRIEIVNEVHANIDLFRDKWDKFCRWVEISAERLNEYQSRETKKCETAYEECREVNQRHKIETRKMERRLSWLSNKGWVKWVTYWPIPRRDYTTRGLTLYSQRDFYAPPDVVNPVLWVFGSRTDVVNPVLWVFGSGNPREPDPDYQKERLLVDCALLVVAHDATVTPAKQIYCQGAYGVKHFDCDGFCQELKGELDRMDREGHLQRAWDDIRPYAQAYPKGVVSAELEAQRLLKTDGQVAQRPDGQVQGGKTMAGVAPPSADNTPDLAADDKEQAKPGKWSRYMPLTQIAERLFKDGKKWRKVKTSYTNILEQKGGKGSKDWRIRLDGFDEDTQKLFDRP